jgi:DNA-directed RNA polymerase subunit beta'
MKPLIEGGDIVEPLKERVLGRTLIKRFSKPKTNELLLPKGTST